MIRHHLVDIVDISGSLFRCDGSFIFIFFLKVQWVTCFVDYVTSRFKNTWVHCSFIFAWFIYNVSFAKVLFICKFRLRMWAQRNDPSDVSSSAVVWICLAYPSSLIETLEDYLETLIRQTLGRTLKLAYMTYCPRSWWVVAVYLCISIDNFSRQHSPCAHKVDMSRSWR